MAMAPRVAADTKSLNYEVANMPYQSQPCKIYLLIRMLLCYQATTTIQAIQLLEIVLT